MEALSKLEEGTAFGQQYKLILTDFNMPHMDGIETSRRIRSFLTARKIQQPLIVGVTCNTQSEYVERATLAGIDKIYAKPLYYEKLVKLL